MSNTFLTPDMITRSALVILHQQANFIGNINRQYDDSFAKAGAKIGDTLRIRLPNQYTVVNGPTYTDVAQTELKTTLTIDTWKQVPMFFTDSDLALKIQDFTDRFVAPAVSVIAASLEANALSMVEDVYQTVDNFTNVSMSWKNVLDANVLMTNALTPADGSWVAILRPRDQADVVNANKGLFQSASEIANQYKKGQMGTSAGYDFYANTLIPTHTSGTTSATTGYTVSSTITVSATTPTTSLTLTKGTAQGSWKAGDVLTIATLNSVHPETKSDTGTVQQFVVTADAAGGTTDVVINVSPAIYMSGARQNVISTVLSTQAVTKLGESSAIYKQSIFFHPDAFTFATADLELPRGTDMASRQVKDGISMRLVRDFDPVYSRMITRLDVLAGKKTLRAQLAARVISSGS